jgi:hypothetical protein
MNLVKAPTRTSIEFAVKAGISTIAAVGLARWIGLSSPYWAGVSAVVATAGSVGASINASITRIVATVIALLIAVGVVLLPVNGLIVAGLTVTVTLIVMSSLRLDAGARLAGASTLLLTAIPQGDPLSTAIGRGLNVPLGCVVAVAIGAVVFPHRAVNTLRIGLTEDLIGAFRLSCDALDQWLDSTVDPNLEDRLHALLGDVRKRDAIYTEATYEPGGMGGRSDSLALALELTKRTSRVTRSLVIVATRGQTDSAQRLLEPELRGVIEALHAAISGINSSHWSDTPALAQRIHSQLRPAIDDMDAGFRKLRERQATAPFSDRDVEHLLHAMWCIHAFDESFAEQGLEAN